MAAILLTGASSFTGLWIAEALSAQGHEVVAPLRRARDADAGLRGLRVARLAQAADLVFDAPLGSPAFLRLVKGRRWDLLAHHAADIPNYRSPDYDPVAGLVRNTEGAAATIKAFARAGGAAVLATGTVFETGEGGDPQAPAATPYGLSKALTNETLRHLAGWAGLGFGRFVIPAPFGPWEERGLAWSLFQAWVEGRTGEVRTPTYVRDHLAAPLLAGAYVEAVAELLAGQDGLVARPSGTVATVGAFARQLAEEVRSRTSLDCALVEHPQTAFPEPRARFNSSPRSFAGAAEAAFWDNYVAFYLDLQARGLLQGAA
ncbi:NAD(P)-dependent oxidoreductase [Phenylobacterium hankyongense]|uniref:NAD(P)-dependent oxidoreductase n=1 Tax=Phenylobacterium hankyongense TaxID=1813876 RepID=A0A328AZH3_9CAUL|nr:NAD(P)-dependent oxidoreductase [Phenylobacterium hankyongense]RAK59997.1 NAD(P)-dependent oxidoreductase [Phenylobacterium hankyongense]